MQSLEDQAKRFGIKKPKLEYQSIAGAYGITTIKLTEASEKLWSEYITKITQAKITTNS